MNIEEFREFCLKLKGVTEELPFDEDTLVFKVMGKMFALTGIESFASINVKCDPDTAIELREQYEAVKPGYHMNKKHWNTIMNNSDMSDKEMLHWVQCSYDLIVEKLPKKVKAELDVME